MLENKLDEKLPIGNESGFLETETNQPKVKWLSVTRGSLIMKSTEDDSKAEKRTNKIGNIVYERFYQKAGIKINNMWISESDYGKQIIIRTMIGEEDFNIAISLDSSYGRSFLKQIFNLDINRHFIIQPYSFITEEGKRITGVSLKQDSKKVEKKFPEGTPEVEFKEKNGKFIINNIQNEERNEYLEEKLIKLIEDNNFTPDENMLPVNKEKELTKEEIEKVNQAKRKVSQLTNGDTDIGDDFFDE